MHINGRVSDHDFLSLTFFNGITWNDEIESIAWSAVRTIGSLCRAIIYIYTRLKISFRLCI